MERTYRNGRGWLGLAILALLGAGRGVAQAPPTASQRGPELYRSGNCVEAAGALQGPGGAAAGLALARCYVDAGDFPRALDAVTAYRAAVPSDVTAVTLMAQVLLKLGRGEEAGPLVETFLTQYPEEIPVRDAWGDVLGAMGQNEKASEQYKKVLAAWPDDPGAHIGLAEIAAREGRWQDAVAEFGKAGAVVPNHFRVLAGLGGAYVQSGNCAEAAGPLRQALNLAPDNLAVAKQLAKCSIELQRWPDVLSALRTGGSPEAGDEEATAMVATAFQRLKNTEGAESYYRAVIKKNPANVTAHVDLGDILYDDSKRRPESRDEYQAAVNLRPDLSARIHERLGDLADGPKKNADARQHYEAAVRQKDATDEVRWKLAQICFDQPDMNCSEKALTQIKSPGYAARVKILRARIAFAAPDLDRAGTLANEVIAASPEHPDLEMLRIAGEVARQKNDPRRAAELYEMAVTQAPDNRELRRQLVRIYLTNEDLNASSRVIDLCNYYLNQVKKDGEFYLFLGQAYDQRKDVPNALTNYDAGFKLIPTPTPKEFSWALDAYGYLLLIEDKNPKAAYTYLTNAVGLNPTDQDALWNLAVACLQLGKVDELADARSKLQALNSPRLPDLDAEIERVQKKAAEKAK